MKCASCGFDNRDDVKFCEECGAQIPQRSAVRGGKFCPECGTAIRPDTLFCENCGTPIQKQKDIITEKTCPQCGSTARIGIVFCETCGYNLELAGRNCANCGSPLKEDIQFCEECGEEYSVSRKAKKQKTKRKPQPTRLGKILGRVGIATAVVITALILIGSLTKPSQPVPILDTVPGPLILINEVVALAEGGAVPAQEFAANISDSEGIKRLEVYADGVMVQAENYSGEQQVVFQPPLQNLPAGEHEVMVNAINTDGKSAQSDIIPVVIHDGEASQAEPLDVELSDTTLPGPTAVNTKVGGGGDSIEVSWSKVPGDVAGYKVKVRMPGTSGAVVIGQVGAEVTSYHVPAPTPGNWEVQVQTVRTDGGEGSITTSKVFIPDTAKLPSAAEGTISFGTFSFWPVRRPVGSVYAYVRIGGEQNRYQRVPEQNGESMPCRADGAFSAEIPGNDWPLSQPLPIEVDLWGWNENELKHLGPFSLTLSLGELRSGMIPVNNAVVEGGSITITSHYTGESQIPEYENIRIATLPDTLPPPENLRLAMYPSDCLGSVNQLGPLRDTLVEVCKTTLVWGGRNFLLWSWPGKDQKYKSYTEQNLTGFEIKYETLDANGKVTRTKSTSIPFPQARGYFISMQEREQEVPCGTSKRWQIRAVGKTAVSPWVYAGSSYAKTCPALKPPASTPPDPVAEQRESVENGCGPAGNPGYLVYDGIFHEACDAHDFCYYHELSGQNKVKCDNNFFKDMVDLCDKEYSGELYAACVGRAFIYYEAVNAAGRFFYEGKINPLDCWREPAVDPIRCSIWSLPETYIKVYDGVIYVAEGTGQLISTGYQATKSGVVTVAKGAAAGAVWIGEGIGSGAVKACKWVKICN